MDIYENYKKAWTLIFMVIGVAILLVTIMVKLDVMAKKSEADFKKLSAEMRWENFLYDQTVLSVLDSQKLLEEQELAGNIEEIEQYNNSEE